MELKDSGKRQGFETGAVRDTDEGKVRWSLLPPCVWEREQPGVSGIVDFIKTGDPDHLSLALGVMLAHEDGLHRLAEHLRKGAEKYSPFNWVKGMPVSRCIDSLGRHLYAVRCFEQDEDHYAAALCNIVFILTYYRQEKTELLDFPGYGEKV
jgi:hypothetical protein